MFTNDSFPAATAALRIKAARPASVRLAGVAPAEIDNILRDLAAKVRVSAPALLEANAADLARMDRDNPKYDRLQLTDERIADIADGLERVAALPSPLDIEIESVTRPNGMTIRKVSVPFGVIGVIYEARPNVTFDVFGLCFKAGSACVLKGGHEAADTNRAAIAVIRRVLEDHNVCPDCAILLDGGREETAEMLHARGDIDLIIPRGGRKLIDYVRDNSLVPVIETGAGVCHTYFHSSGDIATCRDIIYNAKTRRVSVCNALDCLIVDRDRLSALPAVCYHLADRNVEIHADAEAYHALEGAYPYLKEATDDDFGREWLDYKMTIKTVADINEALDYIAANGSHHSECIIAENREAIDLFMRAVDAACVYANVSTAFTDGGQFGFGAEIGISTQKLHARGPMALRQITTYKYLITGSGQTRK
ncbi:MAG: glutamate-5-semialdehyde dehydrogenase [Bacteroidales bacterium]|nr:glutamate-5-semialdehyde dehydrogenase [Bacteroidales bacterium]